jgi:hypothetical protein
MNANHHLDHINIVHNFASSIHLHEDVPQKSSNLPKSVATDNYDAVGSKVASKSTTSFDGVKTSAGKIIGGNLKHQSFDMVGAQIDASDITFKQDGTPGKIHSAINHRFKKGIFKTITTDMSAVAWIAGQSICEGNIVLAINDPKDNSLQTKGSLSYENEVPAKAAFTHYIPHGDGSVSGFTDVDYSSTRFRGSRMTGGYCAVDSRDEHGLKKSSSNVFMSAQGLVQEIHTKNFELKSGELKSKIVCDFSGIKFTPLNNFQSGQLKYVTSDKYGNVIGKSLVHYKKEVLIKTETTQIRKGKTTHSIVTDYVNAEFNNNLNPVNSTIKTTVTTADGMVRSESDTSFDDNGDPVKKVSQLFRKKNGKLFSTVTVDYSNVTFSHSHNPMAGKVEITTVLADGSATSHTERNFGSLSSNVSEAPELLNVEPQAAVGVHESTTTLKDSEGKVQSIKISTTRSDETLFKTVITKMNAGKPVSSSVVLYGIDGESVIKTFNIDLSKIDYDAASQLVTGTMQMEGKFSGAVLDSKSKVTF